MRKLWSVLSSSSFMAILAILGVIFAFYQTFYYERRGEITVTITPPAKVLDISKDVGGLDVSYAGENLRDSKKTLWVVSATIRNDGNAEIRKGDFDENDLLGFLIDNGKIVDTPSLRTSVEYLQKNLTLNQNGNRITLAPSIIEPGDTVFVSFLVLGDEVDKPRILPLGKIAGVRSIEFKSAEQVQRNTIFESIFNSDRWWIHPLRMIVYVISFVIVFAITVGLIASIVVPFGKIKKSKEKSIRRAKVDKYKRGETITKEARALGVLYIADGNNALIKIDQLFRALRKRSDKRGKLEKIESGDDLEKLLTEIYSLPFYMPRLILEMNEAGFPVSEHSPLEHINRWAMELKEFADYLDVDLENSRLIELSTNTFVLGDLDDMPSVRKSGLE